jgi:hypothetical protein
MNSISGVFSFEYGHTPCWEYGAAGGGGAPPDAMAILPVRDLTVCGDLQFAGIYSSPAHQKEMKNGSLFLAISQFLTITEAALSQPPPNPLPPPTAGNGHGSQLPEQKHRGRELRTKNKKERNTTDSSLIRARCAQGFL